MRSRPSKNTGGGDVLEYALLFGVVAMLANVAVAASGNTFGGLWHKFLSMF